MNVKEIYAVIENEDDKQEVEILLLQYKNSYEAFPIAKRYSPNGDLWLTIDYGTIVSNEDESYADENMNIGELKDALLDTLETNFPNTPSVYIYNDYDEENYAIDRVENNRIYLKVEMVE